MNNPLKYFRNPSVTQLSEKLHIKQNIVAGLIHKNHQIFIIMNPIDLNIEEPTLAEPFRCEIEPKLGGCFNSGTVKCKIELDRGGERREMGFVWE